MGSKKAIQDFVGYLSNEDCVYSIFLTEISKIKIDREEIDDLETLINLVEMHEEILNQTRRILTLKQQMLLLDNMAIRAKTCIEE
jgi:hypothetical protein